VHENFKEGILKMESKKFRVDVNYLIGRLEEMLRPTNVETKYSIDVNDYVKFTPTWQIEEFLKELQRNKENYEEKHNAN
jgi:hypothetical protein|tara:strand:+ start:672 stop:908 length:237 start_codon:yes stop_codon:yes gene_type:complete